MRNIYYLCLLGTLMTQAEFTCASEIRDERDQSLNVIKQLNSLHQVANHRQEDMRQEANELRKVYDENRSPIYRKIEALQKEKRKISFAIQDTYQNAYRNLWNRKINEFFQEFQSTGEIFRFYNMVESLLLLGKVLKDEISFKTNQAFIPLKNDIAILKNSIPKLENHELFNVTFPTSQLRTNFLVITHNLRILKDKTPPRLIKMAEIQDINASIEETGPKAENLKKTMQKKSAQLMLACQDGDFQNMTKLTNDVTETNQQLQKVISQQKELEDKKLGLEKQIGELVDKQVEPEISICRLIEIKNCAEFLQKHTAETTNPNLKFNVLTTEDLTFATTVLDYLKAHFAQ